MACSHGGWQMDIDNVITDENELYVMCFSAADKKEGITAFLEKRPAVFQNK